MEKKEMNSCCKETMEANYHTIVSNTTLRIIMDIKQWSDEHALNLVGLADFLEKKYMGDCPGSVKLEGDDE